MSRQDRTTTERNARTLRELVKRPENKVCADCKKNDPRWASWNLGVYLCIRCSGIHRGMGTHISKVKSIDLDTWTPDQMDSIQKWGNHRANLYWEAHLKPGHIPPDHKMESFIRSKYESKRWAREGPPPSDPSILEDGVASPTTQQQQPAPAPAASTARAAPPPTTASARATVTRQPQTHQLLSSNFNNAPQASAGRAAAPPSQPAAVAAQPQAPAAPVNDLFSLDFHAPPPSNPASPEPQAAPKKDVKQDILSLFSTPQPAQAAAAPFGQFSGTAQMGVANAWAAPPQAQPAPTSMIGNNGVGAWGASSGWNAAPANMTAQPNLWANPTSQPAAPAATNLFNTSDVWGSSGATGSTQQQNDPFGAFGSAAPATTQKKDDVFGDLWGGFK